MHTIEQTIDIAASVTQVHDDTTGRVIAMKDTHTHRSVKVVVDATWRMSSHLCGGVRPTRPSLSLGW